MSTQMLNQMPTQMEPEPTMEAQLSLAELPNTTHAQPLIPMQPLDLQTCPLSGRVLIEASAGTGKTYTLVNLCLRLICEAGWLLPQILVVTFTEAAAAELADRLRQRLLQARSTLQMALTDEQTPGSDTPHDTFFAAWLPRLAGLTALPPLASEPSQGPATAGLQLALQRLEIALSQLDRALISTIHGCCRQLLQRFAFQLGVPLQVDLQPDQQPLWQLALEDFWRQQTYGQPSWRTELLLQLFTGPQALLQQWQAFFQGPELDPQQNWLPALDSQALPDLEQSLEAPYLAFCQAHSQLCQHWQHHETELRAQFSAFKGGHTYQARYAAGRLDKLQAYLRAPRCLPRDPDLLKQLGYFSASQLRAKLAHCPAELPFYEQMDLLLQAAEALTVPLKAFEVTWMQTLLQSVRQRCQQQRHQQLQWSFDDLLQQVATGLNQPESGPALAAAIRKQYPVALIDEFQDTDPLQYQIFNTLYPQRERELEPVPGPGPEHPSAGPQLDPEQAGGLFLIGDPKQAIYGFRGADLATYLRAKAAMPASRCYTLFHNFRSRPQVLQALEQLFSAETPFQEVAIPFVPVRAGRSSHWQAENASQAGLICWQPTAEDKQTPLEQQLPGWIALDILQRLGSGRCAWGTGEQLQPLRAGDIAVLVRSHRQGAAIRDALQTAGLPAVLHAEESVFASREAQELGLLLQAVLRPQHTSSLFSALSGASLGYRASEIFALQHDPEALEKLIGRFYSYRQRWFEKGFAPMWHSLQQGEQLYARLLRHPDALRRITNFRHLAELLQQQSHWQQQSPSLLLNWLARQRQSGSKPESHQLLQLDSDQDAVQIMTLHKSKGLEFPVVYCPTLWTAPGSRSQTHPPLRFQHPERGECLDFGSPDWEQHLTLQETAQRKEEIRLAYVGLTRARFLTVVALGWNRSSPESALANLLQVNSEQALQERLQDLAQASTGSLQVLPPPTRFQAQQALAGASVVSSAQPGTQTQTQTRSQPAQQWVAAAPHLQAAPRPQVPRPWRQRGFSALTRELSESELFNRWEPLEPEAADLELAELNTEPSPDINTDINTEPAVAEAESAEHPFMTFPKGAQHGSFLHLLLEKCPAWMPAEARQQKVRQLLHRKGYDPELWADVLVQKLTEIWQTPLTTPEGSFCLQDLRPGLREMEFHLPLAQALQPETLNAEMHSLQPTWLPVQFQPFKGMLSGVIDLMVGWQGKYYLIDYKSNFLGLRWQDYRAEALQEQLRLHHYTLQGSLYLVALMRYLASRLPDFDPAQHLGGAFFLFLRGLQADATGSEGQAADQAPAGQLFYAPPLAHLQTLNSWFAAPELPQVLNTAGGPDD